MQVSGIVGIARSPRHVLPSFRVNADTNPSMNRFPLVRFLPFLLLLMLPLGAGAQLLKPATWTARLEPAAPKAGQTATIVFKATIDAGWHVYTNDFSPDVGPVPLQLVFMPDGSYELVGKAEPVNPHRYVDEIFGGEVADWKGKAELRQKVKVKSLPLKITGTVESQACTEAGKCTQLTDDFTLTASGPARSDAAPTQPEAPKAASATPTEIPAVASAWPDTATTAMAPPTPASADNPLASGSLKPQTAPVQQASVVPATAATAEEGSRSLWMWFWVAFGSGLLALLTPCVYPMVPMTVSFFTRQGQTRAKGLGLAATFGLSIVGLYVLIGVIVSRLFGGDVANEIATHWLPNTLFFIIFVAFGFSFLGYFEITLPSSWSTAADERAEKGGIVGVFFVALTLVIVSFSCTGPIASGILIESARGAVVQPVVAMLGFSLAFALPFSLFAAFPHAMQSLPRSGTWMNSVKVVLGFLELALALKFLSVADLAYHWHLLDREVYLALWIVIFTLLGFYLLGKLRFPHDSEGDRPVGWQGLVLAITSFAFVVYLIPGMWGAPLRALSGYLPPLETQDFRPMAGAPSTGSEQPSATPTAGCPAPRYADFLHLPHGLQGYFDLNEAFACAKVTGKPVFIDFTGHGCTNCREMEARVWSKPEVLERLRDKFTVCALYVDDRTELPANEQYTSKVDGKLKANIGKRNLDMQVERFNSNAQPQYVILSPDGQMLAGPHAYDLDVNAFVNFLDAGLAKAKTL